MKIAISSTGKDMESQVDVRFGRCPYFMLVDLEGKDVKRTEAIENTATSQMGGAGISASQLVADKGAKAVITGNVGPRASSVFQQLDIDVYQGTGTIKQVVGKFVNNELEKMQGPSGPMGAGMPGGKNPGAGRGMGRGRMQ